jgi:hypothetical protein
MRYFSLRDLDWPLINNWQAREIRTAAEAREGLYQQVPNPVLWGVFAMLLRFVPYIGSVIAAAFPVALAIAVAPGWSMI